MKRITGRLRTLMTKLIAMLITISLVPVLVTGISSTIISKMVLAEQLELSGSQTTKEVTRGIDSYISAMSNMVEILSNEVNLQEANNPTYFEFAKGLMANTKNSDEKILNIYVGTESGMFYTDPYADLPKDFDHRKRDWYFQATNNPDKVIVTDPYIDTGTGTMVISLCAAITKDNNLIGVVGIDVDLTSLSRSLSEIKVGKEGYIFIVDNRGIILSHPDLSLIGVNVVDQITIWDVIKNEAHGFEDYSFKNEDRFAVYDTSEVTGWKVIASMNYSELSNNTRAINTVVQLVVIITAIVSILVAVFFSIPISRNIKKLLAAFSKLSDGDLRTTVSIKSKDEFHTLGIHFNEMAANISRLIHNVSDASITVLDTSVSLANMSEETNASLSEVARAVEEVAKGATEQAQHASDGAYSVSELGDKLSSVSASTNMINSLSKNANDLTLQGLSRMENLMQKSDHTMQSTSKVTELVYETSESMQQIDAISNAIDMITAQTNLLALNASIEAARAGESGKGFAVVANEIRKLAEQSKSSTLKIKNIVEDIAQKTTLSVEAMEITNKNVQEQVSLVKQTQSLFHNIMDAVRVLSEKVSEIQQSTSEITNQKDNIVSQIENISAISEESASATEEVTSSTEQIAVTMDEIARQASNLQTLSEELQERLNTFKF